MVLKLYQFCPQQAGTTYLVMATDPEGAKTALLNYFAHRVEDGKAAKHSATASNFLVRHYTEKHVMFNTAFMNLMLPDDYILIEIDENEVLEIDNND